MNPFKNLKLTKYEQELVDAMENGEFVPVENLEEEIKKAKQIAKNTLLKNRNINLRLTMQDLSRLKAKAIEEGIPYQTLAASILHKYVSK